MREKRRKKRKELSKRETKISLFVFIYSVIFISFERNISIKI